MGLTRRSFITGLIAAPAIVRVSSIMPVKSFSIHMEWTEGIDYGAGDDFTAVVLQNVSRAAQIPIGYLIGKPKRTPAGFLIAEVVIQNQGVINMIVHNSARRMQIGETMYAHNEIRSLSGEAQEKEDAVTIIGPRQIARRSDDA
jgi:hypothetical protein